MFDKRYYSTIFQLHPELLGFLTEEIDATADYQMREKAPWMDEMYQAAEETLTSMPKEGLLTSFLSKTSLANRSIELERTMLSIMVIESVVSNDYNFFETTPVPFGSHIT